MKRLRSRYSLAYVLAASFMLAACGGGGSHGTVPAAVPGGSGGAGAPVDSASATFTFTFPKSTSSAKRSPQYLSSATASISVQVTDTKTHGTATDIYANVPAPLKVVQFFNPANLVGNPNTPGQCGTDPGNAGNVKCTAKFQLPIGDNTVTIASYSAASGGGSVLSQQILGGASVVWIQQGVANAFTVSLDANAVTMTVDASSGNCASSFAVGSGQNVATVGTNPVNFTVSYTDAAGKTIVAPGLPLLKINGSSTTGTITGTGGNVNFTVNQAAQSFTLTATTAATSAPLTVTATPPNADGLAYSKSLSFSMQSGPAPPGSFLADAEQTINGSGVTTGAQIHLWTVALGASDTFTPYVTSTLAVTNPGTGNDIDFTNDLLFDGGGDLLLANGGAGSPDFGNFACVPAGSITTGANNATVLTANVDDPVSIAYSNPAAPINGDGSVMLLDQGNGETFIENEFLLSGTYAAAPVSRDVMQNAFPSDGPHANAVALPATVADPAGSYAFAIVGSGNFTAIHKIIKHPDGTVFEFPQDAHDTNPNLAYDATANQLAVVNEAWDNPPTTTNAHLTFWNVASRSKVVDLNLDPDGNGNTMLGLGPIAASPDGHVAIIESGSGFPVLRVYNTAANGRAAISNFLDYGAADCPTQTNLTYGGTGAVNVANRLIWLSNTKLLVELYSQNNHVITAANGLYIYDVTQTMAQGGCDFNDANEPATTYKQTGFVHLTSVPFAAAFKP